MDSFSWKLLSIRRKMRSLFGYTYIRNRFVNKTHTLQTGLPKGQRHEWDKRVSYAILNEFIMFFEREVKQHCEVFGWDSCKNGATAEQIALAWLDVQAKAFEDECGAHRRTEYDIIAGLYKEAKAHMQLLQVSNGYPPCYDEVGQWSFDVEKAFHDAETALLQEIIKYRSYLWT